MLTLRSPDPASIVSFSPGGRRISAGTSPLTLINVKLRSVSSRAIYDLDETKKKIPVEPSSPSCGGGFCNCGRRQLIGGLGTALLPLQPSNASDMNPEDDPLAVLKRIHPPRPDWYEEFYASAINSSMKPYESEISGYKSKIFANLRGKAERIVEIGIGTGPNLKYYANYSNVHVLGIDPNRKMERYAQSAAEAAGLPPQNFKFVQAVAEALPLNDASVDAIVGTLVLCSVKDAQMALQEVRRVLRPGGLYLFVEHVAAEDGTLLRFVQGVLDPLQQTVADGCHLTRKTGTTISEAGFSNVDMETAFLASASLVNPQLYGIARK